MRWLLALMAALCPGLASACYEGYSKLDDVNPQFEAVFGFRFNGSPIKASSMNNRCWRDARMDIEVLRDLWAGGTLEDKPKSILGINADAVDPDYATYSNDQDAYAYGRRTRLQDDVFRLTVLANTERFRSTLRDQFSQRGFETEAGEAGNVTNTTATTSFNDMPAEIFTSHVDGGWSGGDTYQSAAMFTAPARADLLIVVLGDTNYDTDRKEGILIEETLHQALRQIEPLSKAPETCPFKYTPDTSLNHQTAPLLGLWFGSEPVKAGSMTGLCWAGTYTVDDFAARIADGGVPGGVETLLDVATRAPDGSDLDRYAMKISLAPWDLYLENRPVLIEGGMMRPSFGAKDKVEHRHQQVTANGIKMDVYTAYIDAPFLKSDSYLSGVVFQAPTRSDLAVMIRGDQHERWSRVEGALMERTLHTLIEGMSRTNP